MEKLTNEQRALRKELANKYSKAQLEARDEALKTFPEEIRKFLLHSYRDDEGLNGPVGKKLQEGLASGKYEKPSQFVIEELSCIFGTILPETLKESLLYSVDECRRCAYSSGYYRRPFRSRDYALYAEKVYTIIYAYAMNTYVKKPFEEAVAGNLTEEERAYFEEHPNARNEFDICFCIDKGCPTTLQYITELLDGASNEGLTYDIFRALFMSRSRELHEAAGRLLLAARLQEGLRQAICETCDCGSLEAFKYMIGVITDNDLIRYSSVKRAVSTWSGLAAADSGDIERISSKTLALINGCLADESFRGECLSSDDAMKVDIALWSIAVEDAVACKDKMEVLCESGTHPQIMAASYFLRELWSPALSAQIALRLLLTRSNELDVMALIMGQLFRGGKVTNSRYFKPADLLERFFTSRSQAEEAYARLFEIYTAIPKKALEFTPCVFPWNTEKLTKSDVVSHLIYLAAMLEDNDKIDVMCQKIAEIDVSGYGTRRLEIELLLSAPKTDTQMDALISELADREEYSRGAAFMIVGNLKDRLTPHHYLMMEDMLRFKSSDIRGHIITLLMKQNDDALFETVKRLVSDKKEEKRTAGLDIIIQLGKDDDRRALAGRCLPLASLIENPTTKEQILIDSITASADNDEDKPAGYGLYSPEDSFTPSADFGEFGKECMSVFAKYFPGSEAALGKKAKPVNDFDEPLKALDELIEANKNLEYTSSWGEKVLLGSEGFMREKAPDGSQRVPFGEIWDKYYDEHIKDPVLLFRTFMGQRDGLTFEYSYKLFGEEYRRDIKLMHPQQVISVLEAHLIPKHIDKAEMRKCAFAMNMLLLDAFNAGTNMTSEVHFDSTYWNPTYYYVKEGEVVSTNKAKVVSIYDDVYVKELKLRFFYNDDEHLKEYFSLGTLLAEKSGALVMNKYLRDNRVSSNYSKYYEFPDTVQFIIAAFRGVISEGYMYKYFLEQSESLGAVLETVSGIVQSYRDSERKRMTRQRWGGWRSARALSYLLNENQPEITDKNRPLVEYAVGIYEKLTELVLNSELKRGDSNTEFTDAAIKISRIYGADRFVQILSALGRDPLERSGGYYSGGISKRQSLSRLLGVCVPRDGDTAATLAELLKGTDITDKRLVEAALYSPEWIDIVGEYLGWEGFRPACFYFMAHMNEHFDDVRKATIAKFTPISTEELSDGAFDISWFREAFETVGEKRFDMIYDAAKYISDGAKHSRARKYADAVLGRLDRKTALAQINDKRNKDTLMAYALIPISDEDDIFERYLLFRKFRKESAKFGAQRRASESAAADMAMQNLAVNAGYSDVTRLTLRMETKLFDDIRPLTEPNTVGDITLTLMVDENGRAEVLCEKGGKALKSVPAKYKKDETVIRMGEVKKQLTEQYRRTRLMLEQAMEDRTPFKASELNALNTNPVVSPMIRSLVFTDGKHTGFLEGMKLISAEGKETKLKDDTALIIAHPFDLYTEGSWRDYQKALFDSRTAQPFKQVFRELYVKTEDEKEAFTSLRYAGNQIQPKQTVGCLKGRRWVADVEDGLQKVYYKENIIARIYALADWFSPGDIEAPTLEWVDFFDRRTGRQLCLDDIPDIIFSEVMRDVDLAVSVAHAGGVDPETSHSTVEMRRAICEFTLPLFGITNVTFEKSHAFITGKRADYSIHLGSGVIHLQGGPMINVLPVHSQHRGKLFLPFVDEDPKTAQIISEILLFAEDDKIKDPFILDQIK